MNAKWTAQGSTSSSDPHTFGPRGPPGGVGGGIQLKQLETEELYAEDLTRQWAVGPAIFANFKA